jgi:hypothetical protein
LKKKIIIKKKNKIIVYIFYSLVLVVVLEEIVYFFALTEAIAFFFTSWCDLAIGLFLSIGVACLLSSSLITLLYVVMVYKQTNNDEIARGVPVTNKNEAISRLV